jgi:hypothetical protein
MPNHTSGQIRWACAFSCGFPQGSLYLSLARFAPQVFPKAIRTQDLENCSFARNATRKMIVFDPEFRPKQTLRNHTTAYSQRRITFQSREGSRSLSASESWRKPRANQSLSVEYLDSPYSSPGRWREPKTTHRGTGKCFLLTFVRSDGSVVSWSRSQLQIAFLPSKSDNPQAQH